MKLMVMTLILMMSHASFASQLECEQAALDFAKAIRHVENPTLASKATFKIIQKTKGTEEPLPETYLVEMLVPDSNGRLVKPMSNQKIVIVGGGTCVLAYYGMPEAG